MIKAQGTYQEITTDLGGADVLARAKQFFSSRPTLYAAFLDKEGPNWCSFRGQGGEEIVVAVSDAPDGRTRVTASTYLFEMQVARFLSTFAPAGVEVA